MEVEFVNMKKLFPDEKGTKKGIREFLDKKGFYIVLLLCIAVVAGTAVFVTTRNATSGQPDYEAENLIPEEDGEDVALNEDNKLNAQQPEDTQASAAAGQQSGIGKPASITNTDSNSAVQPKDDGAKGTEPKAPAKSTAPKSSGSKNTAQAKQQSFKMPVTGDVTLEYAKDKLVYSKTLEEWRAHAGVDIASDRGTPVKAVADGVISDVRSDSYYGITVVIDHGNGLESLYRNLASDETVAVNQRVKQGEVIGSIGNTAMDESSEQPHLHFEVLNKDVNVDPMTYLPKSSANAE
jgi:murein DD-endopeptidase MepM/ murein hydrolase activator NlpD